MDSHGSAHLLNCLGDVGVSIPQVGAEADEDAVDSQGATILAYATWHDGLAPVWPGTEQGRILLSLGELGIETFQMVQTVRN